MMTTFHLRVRDMTIRANVCRIPVQLEEQTMGRSEERESKLQWYEIPIQPYHGSRITIASGANLYRSFVPKGTSNVGCARTFGPCTAAYTLCINIAQPDFHEVFRVNCNLCDVPFSPKLR